MRDIFTLFLHAIVIIIRLARPGGLRSVVAESVLMRHQVLILNRDRKRAPNLTRKVEIGGIASSVNGLWMNQIARNLTDVVDGLFAGKRYLIHDRDPLYTKEFLTIISELANISASHIGST